MTPNQTPRDLYHMKTQRLLACLFYLPISNVVIIRTPIEGSEIVPRVDYRLVLLGWFVLWNVVVRHRNR